MSVTLRFENGDQLGRRFKKHVSEFDERRIRAIQSAARQAAAEIEQEGRADMRAGGDFGSARWQEGFRAKVSFQSRQEINVRVTHAVFYWKVFEFGATIHGKPMLWIPLEFAGVPAGMRARDYPEPLFRVDRKGKAPLLVSKTGPKYFGKESVRIPKKFHLREIVKQVSRRLGDFYREAMRHGR